MNWTDFQSPLPRDGEAKECVELFIYDDDGPEGYCKRLRFERSADAVRYLKTIPEEDLVGMGLNFTLTNHWKRR